MWVPVTLQLLRSRYRLIGLARFLASVIGKLGAERATQVSRRSPIACRLRAGAISESTRRPVGVSSRAERAPRPDFLNGELGGQPHRAARLNQLQPSRLAAQEAAQSLRGMGLRLYRDRVE